MEAADDLRGDTSTAIKAAGLDPRVTSHRRQLEARREMELCSDEDYAAGLAELEGLPE